MRKIKICIIFGVYLIFFIIVPCNVIYFFMFIALHEMAHCAICKKYNLNIEGIIFLPFGFNAEISENFIDPVKDIIISSSGPLCNLFFYLLFLILNLLTNNYFKNEQLINLILFAFNIIPAGFLDGGRILSAAIKNYVSLFYGYYTICLNGIIFGCIIIVMAFFNISSMQKVIMTAMGIYFIFFSLYKLKNIKFLILKDIIYKENYLKNKKRYWIKSCGYSGKNRILNVMNNFSMSSYSIVYVYDLNSSSTVEINEFEIIGCYLKYGNITLANLISKKAQEEN